MVSGDSFQNACVSSSPLGIGKQIRIPKMQLAFRSNSKDKKRHTPNFVAKNWFHLTVLTRSGFCSCQLLQPRCSNSLIHPSTCLLSCAFFFIFSSFYLLSAPKASIGICHSFEFFLLSKSDFHHDHFRAGVIYIPLLHAIQQSTESLKLLVEGYCTFSCVCKHLICEPFLLGPLS